MTPTLEAAKRAVTMTVCSETPCGNAECCVADGSCSAYTGDCAAPYSGRISVDVTCTGTCDEYECCLFEDCSLFPESSCPTSSAYNESATCLHAASGYGCDYDCCPPMYCGNTYDYVSIGCSISEGPAWSYTICSTGANGVCDTDLCCVRNESCNEAVGDNACEHPLNYNGDETCDGACEAGQLDSTCCSHVICMTSFDPDDCGEDQFLVTTGVCDDGECSSTICCQDDETCADFTDECAASTTAAEDTVQCTGACSATTCCLDDSGAVDSVLAAFRIAVFGATAASAAATLAGLRLF